MMRSLKLIVTTMAVVNVLGLVGLLGWLGATRRVDGERVRAVVALFEKTVDQERAEEAAAEREAEAARQAAEADRSGVSPVPVEGRIEIVDELERIAEGRTKRMEADAQILRDTIARERAALEADIAAFAAEREAFMAMREQIAEQEGDEQFAKAVKTYEALKSDQAASMMRELIRRGERQQVVAYLDAMNARSATKVIQAIQDEDARLASDLVESLRTFGLVAESAEAPTDDPTP